ncbi:MAG: hypothetical protein SCM96_11100 [Acidobacteriota bacterium]|nr:hypothetical protein [Acidobacteriota bacterium]
MLSIFLKRFSIPAISIVVFSALLNVGFAHVSVGDDIPAERREGTYLYRFAMLQAGPGSMLELMNSLKKIGDSMTEEGEERPIIVQHHQGDHWDLLVIYPLDGHAPFRVTEANGRRAEAVLAEIRPLLLWHEDLFVMGPEVDVLRGFLEGKGLVHFEMMQSLPGKFENLVEERRMENTYNRLRGRGQTLIFTHAAGAAWDVVTLGAYKDWYEYADSAKIPREVSDKAARDAGFPSAAGVGLYMRTLISTHRDTLGPVIY